MGKNHQSIKELIYSIPEYPVPPGLEQRVICAIHTEQQRSEKLSYRLWTVGLFGSILAVLSGLAWSLQSLNAKETVEIIKIAVSNVSVLRLSDVFWGIMENLPLNGLTLTFCAITVLGLLTSVRKNHQQNTLSLQHI